MSNQHKARRKELAIAIGLALAVSVAAGEAQADFSPDFELSDLNGANGVVLNGVAEEDNAGQSVSQAADINGDGIDDLVVGAPCATTGPTCAGAGYVVFGSDQGLSNPLSLSDIDGTNGLVVNGANTFDFVGFSVGGAGDVNGDGFSDLVLGAPESSLNADYAGASFVVFGSDQGFLPSLSVSDLTGTNGFAILGTVPNSSTGTSVSMAGDVNGDGIDDLIIGAPYSGNGAAYIVFGSDESWDPTLAVSGLVGSNGFKIDGINAADSLGKSVAAAGDINGDGIDDLIVGATLAGTEGAYAGAGYVVFGSDQDWAATFDLTTLDGSNGFAIVGQTQGDFAGNAVSTAGDINGDGIDDVFIGAPFAGPNGSKSGASYVVFGSDQGFLPSLSVSDLTGTNGFALHGVSLGDESGSSLSAAGDVNNDTIDDLIIGAPLADSNGDASGASYVVFGSKAWPDTVELSSLNGTSGFRVTGVRTGDQSGTSVSAAGDINADGRADFLLGARFADPNGDQSGAAYAVFDATAVDSDIIFSDSFEQ